MLYMQQSSQPIDAMRSENCDRLSEESHRHRAPSRDMSSEHAFTPTKEMTKYQSTPDGNVVIVEQSFDSEDPAAINPGKQSSPTSDASGRAAQTPVRKPVHRRDLSAHFYDATRLSDELQENRRDNGRDYPVQHARPQKSPAFSAPRASPSRPLDGGAAAFSLAANQPPVSPAVTVGNKHRRGYSGGFSNPAVAHRRMNSIGDSQQVDRYGYYHGSFYPPPAHRPSYPTSHRREHSAGLDILSAVADESKEQIEMAVGPKRRSPNRSWEPEPNPAAERRMEPPRAGTASSSYEYSSHHSQPHYGYTGHPPSMYYQQQHQDSYYPPNTPINYSQRGGSYPVQYAPLKDRTLPPNRPVPKDKIDSEEKLFAKKEGEWRGGGGTTTGVQTFVTAISVGNDKERTLMPAPVQRSMGTNTDGDNPPIPSSVGHHRKLSSYSSLGTLMGSGLFADPDNVGAAGGRHHRSTSSSVSLLQGLASDSDMFFMSNITAQQPQGIYNPSSYGHSRPTETPSTQQLSVVSSNEGTGRALAQGGTSKRIRRKCTMKDCENRVVQGGLCISHGAKRKTCRHPGCTKNVKKAGLCSTHGPARKRCEEGVCNKVAVQGGRCIAHGAKKKLCSMENCTKQAILSGMCKKHHDATNGIMPSAETSCVVIDAPAEKLSSSTAAKRPSHTRGLSIFQEMSAESLQTVLSPEEITAPHPLKDDTVHPLKTEPGHEGPL